MGADNSTLKTVKFLGKGAYGNVELVKDRNGNQYAKKEILVDAQQEEIIAREIDFMKMVDNKNIIKYYYSLPVKKASFNLKRDLPPEEYDELVATKNIKKKHKKIVKAEKKYKNENPDLKEYNLILEYCEGGDLRSYTRVLSRKLTHLFSLMDAHSTRDHRKFKIIDNDRLNDKMVSKCLSDKGIQLELRLLEYNCKIIMSVNNLSKLTCLKSSTASAFSCGRFFIT